MLLGFQDMYFYEYGPEELECIQFIIDGMCFYIKDDLQKELESLYIEKEAYELLPEVIDRRERKRQEDIEIILSELFPSIYMGADLIDFWRQFEKDYDKYFAPKITLSYIYLDSNEKTAFANCSHEYLIEHN